MVPLAPNGEIADDYPTPSHEAVRNLNIIQQLTGAEVVVSSSWRLQHSFAELDKIFLSWGVASRIIAVTPDSSEGDRGAEISAWLRSTREKVTSFIVLDDEQTDTESFSQNRVLVKPDIGIQWHDAVEAVRILTRP